MAEPLPILAEVVLGEIILRLPPDQPGSLFRALAVNRDWRDFCRKANVLRDYRELHKAPPFLGFLQNFLENRSLFFTASPAPPIYPPDFNCDIAMALDCRHGRVLLHTIYYHLPPYPCLVVWNPITGDQQSLPEFNHPAPPFSHYTGAVLCAVPGCNHLDCRGGAFRVLFVATAMDKDVQDDYDYNDYFAHIHEDFTWATLYSSETGSWTQPAVLLPGPVMNPCSEDLLMGPSLLAGDTLYFTLDLQTSRTILSYDFGEDDLSVMDPPHPQAVRTRRDTFLVKLPDEQLGVAVVEGYSLHLWSWNDGGWAPWRVDLEGILPFTIGNSITQLKVIGFAEMSRLIFVSANGGIIFTFNLNSGEVRRVGQTDNSTAIYPYEVFYTPGMEAA